MQRQNKVTINCRQTSQLDGLIGILIGTERNLYKIVEVPGYCKPILFYEDEIRHVPT